MGSLGKEKRGVYWRRDDPDAPFNQPRKQRGRKDRKRWCRGKPGREHTPMLTHTGGPCEPAARWRVQVFGSDWACHHVEVCEACGKRLRWLNDDECPDAP